MAIWWVSISIVVSLRQIYIPRYALSSPLDPVETARSTAMKRWADPRLTFLDTLHSVCFRTITDNHDGQQLGSPPKRNRVAEPLQANHAKFPATKVWALPAGTGATQSSSAARIVEKEGKSLSTGCKMSNTGL